MIKAEAVYRDQGKAERKFDHFKLTIGDQVFEPIPFRYLLISELPILEKLLNLAAIATPAQPEPDQRGVERYNRSVAALLAKENFVRRW